MALLEPGQQKLPKVGSSFMLRASAGKGALRREEGM